MGDETYADRLREQFIESAASDPWTRMVMELAANSWVRGYRSAQGDIRRLNEEDFTSGLVGTSVVEALRALDESSDQDLKRRAMRKLVDDQEDSNFVAALAQIGRALDEASDVAPFPTMRDMNSISIGPGHQATGIRSVFVTRGGLKVAEAEVEPDGSLAKSLSIQAGDVVWFGLDHPGRHVPYSDREKRIITWAIMYGREGAYERGATLEEMDALAEKIAREGRPRSCDLVGERVSIEGVVTEVIDDDPEESTAVVTIAGQQVHVGVCSSGLKRIGRAE